MNAHPLYTVGHSSRTLEEFVDVLVGHGIARVADVRRHPASRRHPQFGSAALRAGLVGAGIEYRHFEALGGMRDAVLDSPHVALGDSAFRGYADHMDTSMFADALDALLDWADEGATVAMCAERLPEQCHRSFLADAVVARGGRVLHLLGPGSTREHTLHPQARRDGVRLLYTGAQESLGL